MNLLVLNSMQKPGSLLLLLYMACARLKMRNYTHCAHQQHRVHIVFFSNTHIYYSISISRQNNRRIARTAAGIDSLRVYVNIQLAWPFTGRSRATRLHDVCNNISPFTYRPIQFFVISVGCYCSSQFFIHFHEILYHSSLCFEASRYISIPIMHFNFIQVMCFVRNSSQSHEINKHKILFSFK